MVSFSPRGFATPGAYRLQESDTYLNFSTSSGTIPTVPVAA